MVALDATDAAVHPAKLWNDTESAPDAAWLLGQLRGPAAWADAVGSVPVAAFTATKLSWLHRTHPEAWAEIAHVLLPHDYLTHRLTGALHDRSRRRVGDRLLVTGDGGVPVGPARDHRWRS